MIEEFRGKLVDEKTGPNIAKLMASGFDPRFRVERLENPIRGEGQVFISKCLLLVIPRAKAARKYRPAVGEVVCNVRLEMFAAEAEHGETQLRDIYAEKCAATLIGMLEREAPGVLVASA